MNRSPTIRIGRDAEYPTSYVQERFSKITAMHIERVMEGIADNRTQVRNTRAYLLASLFNSVSTLDNQSKKAPRKLCCPAWFPEPRPLYGRWH